MNIIVILALLMVAAIIYLSSGGFGGKRNNRQDYLEKMAKFLEAPLQKIDENQNSYYIKFGYKGREFVYEDIEEFGFQKSNFRGVLRAPIPVDLNLAFTERSRTAMRDSVSSIQDITSPWMQNVGKVMAPIELKEFSIHTNNQRTTNVLLADEQIVKIFVRYKNVDTRGHPIMSMELINGTLLLRFHPPGGGLIPNLGDLQHNVTTIEEYLNRFLIILDKLDKIKEEETRQQA